MKGLSKILLALDFGETTDVIVKRARDLAKCFSAQIIPVHVVEIAAMYSGSPVVDMHQIYQKIAVQMDELRKTLSKNGVSVLDPIIKNGNPEKIILELAHRLDVNLVLLGAHKKNIIERFMGSTAEHTIRNSSKPVFCVHPQDSLGPIENVVCALDGSSSSSHTLNETIEFCRSLKSKLHILHVVPFSNYYPSLGELRSPISEWGDGVIPDIVAEHQALEEEIDQKEEMNFDKFLQCFDLSGLDHTHEVCRGNASDQIVEHVKGNRCDLLTMGATDQKQATTFFARGTIEKVLRKVSCSVLTIKHLRKGKNASFVDAEKALS